MVVQRPLFQLKGAPKVSFIKNEEERRHFNRKMLKHLTPEQKEELKALHIDMWEGFNRVLKQMPNGLFRQNLNGTGTGTLADIMLCNSHCSGTRNFHVCLCVLNRDPNVPRGFVDIMLGNDVTFV